MWNRKNRAEVSTSRFCRAPLELPYARLYRHDFVVAVSKFARSRTFPLRDSTWQDPVAYGILHGSSSYPDSDEPLLPVEVTFERNPRETDGFGSAGFDRSGEDGEYLLYVTISDPDGSIAAAFDASMSRAILSGHNFKHLKFIRNRDPDAPRRDDFHAQYQEDLAFLQRVEAGEAELEWTKFDRVFFDDDLTTKAPGWSWGWRAWEFSEPQFQSAKTAKWRRNMLPHRKPKVV